MNKVPVEIDGVKYESLKAACKALNLSYKTVLSRRYESKTILEQFSNNHLYQRSKHKMPIIVNGVKYKSIREMCIRLNLDYVSVCTRIRRGSDIQSAIDTPFKAANISDKLTINGITYTSINDMAVKTNLHTSAFFYKLVKNCQTPEEKQVKIQEWFDTHRGNNGAAI